MFDHLVDVMVQGSVLGQTPSLCDVSVSVTLRFAVYLPMNHTATCSLELMSLGCSSGCSVTMSLYFTS